jgi:hypothetical protein
MSLNTWIVFEFTSWAVGDSKTIQSTKIQLKEGSEEVDFLKKVAELATYTISVTFGC